MPPVIRVRESGHDAQRTCPIWKFSYTARIWVDISKEKLMDQTNDTTCCPVRECRETGRLKYPLAYEATRIQSFQLTLSVQSMELKDKTESLRGIFMNKFIKISHAWRKQ